MNQSEMSALSIKERADYLRERGKASPALRIAKTAFDHASKVRLKNTPKHQILEWIGNNVLKIDECEDGEENKEEARLFCFTAYESVQKRILSSKDEAGGNAAGNAKQSKDGYKRKLPVHVLGNENRLYSGSDDDLDYD
jgi:hypothetical protein